MPCRKPTELALAHQIAGLCHAGVAEIGGVGKNRCQDSAGIIMYAARGEMGKAFREAGPTINLRQQVSNLVEDSIDCVLRVGPLNDSGLIARPIGKLLLINVVSPAYVTRHGTPGSPEDLGDHWAVNYASPTSGRVEDWEWLEQGKLHRVPLRGRVTVNSAEAYIACCLAGLGMIQIPAYDVKQHLEAGELVEVMPGHRAELMPMTLLYPHRQHLSHRLQVFADWLETLLKDKLL